ncbi:hybrid sensor histidine kinase/response regulator transcription factor [Spirosoma aerolatum]|uniref:hybrid sensor histidine kinase/response regulator transcription factor n=1 Tax=Spirosoma aerolatum TaxID=1211326 RepID=UPI0009ACF70D|nr:response regulator [Spirosoma aerolatum]
MRTLYLLFVLISYRLLAQPTNPTAKGWQALTISDGLSQGMIYDLKQAGNGFIWLATKDGLNRYDGHNFSVYTHDPYNPYSLSDNSCSALLVDSRGRLWVGTLNQGLNLFDDRSQRFYHIDIRDTNLPGAGNHEVRLLAEDPDGNIWVNTDQDKLFRISLPDHLKTGFPTSANFTAQARFSSITLAGMATIASAHHIQFRPDGTATVGTTYGMCSFNWRQLRDMRPVNRPANLTVREWYTDDDAAQGNYWFSTQRNQVHGWLRGTHKVIGLPRQTTGALVEFLDSTTVAVATLQYLWLMKPDQLFGLDSLTARNAFTVMSPDAMGLTAFMRDRTGSIWFGTMGYGVRVFNPNVNQFTSFLPKTSVTYLHQDRAGHLYVRYFQQYAQLDKASNRLVPFLTKTNDESEPHQNYLMQSRSGFLWISNIDYNKKIHQLLKYTSNGQLLNVYRLPSQTAFGTYLNQTVEDQAGKLWIGAINGKLLQFDPEKESFIVFSYKHLLPQSGAEIEVGALYFDRAGTLWIGTTRGLVRADHPQGQPSFTIYKNDVTDRHSLSHDVVSSMVDDPNQPNRYLWVSTKGGGLERLDKRLGQFRHFTEAQGLPNKVVYGILTDEFRNLWMSTNRGLAQFNPQTFTFRTYSKADGLQDDEFNTGSYFKTAAGELLFGGVNGLTAFRAKDVVRKTLAPPQTHLVSLKINNEPITVGGADGILSQSIENTSRIDLAYDQNLITLEFAVMNFANPAHNQYRYRLVGIDDGWVEAGTNRFANYAQLPYGRYTLQMMGSADGETWSQPVTLHIRIHPPFYRTWWAYLIYALAVGFAGWQLYRFQKQRWLLQQQVSLEKQEASRLAELDALKTNFFANISHEFRTPLTLILGPIEQMAQEYAHDSRFPMLQRNANRLLSLINQLLDLSKLEAGQLRAEPEPGDMAAFFRMLASSFSSLAESRRITFTFSQNESERWVSFDRDKVEKIMTNLLANAFKFTPAGHTVSLTVQYPDQVNNPVVISVSDTGIGIATERLPHIFERFYQGATFTRSAEGKNVRPYEGTGIGLALVHELVKILGGSISVISTEGEGTTFAVTLPLADSGDSTVRWVTGLDSGVAPFVVTDGNHALERPKEAEATLATAENILLIIDDNADIRAYIRSIFAADYQILEAEDGQEGLQKATASLPDMIICDLMMPRLDGFGFCRALKKQEATSHIPVVMLTARATVEDRIEGFELGADDYLTKPFNREEIRARVKNLVQQRQRLYQWFSAKRTGLDTLPLASREPVPALLVSEQQFIDRLTQVVNQYIDEPALSVEMLAGAVNMSRSQLHRKLKAVLDTSPTNFIRKVRLIKAASLLVEGNQSITMVAYAVGFDNLSYFAKVFQEEYGMLPSHYRRTENSGHSF